MFETPTSAPTETTIKSAPVSISQPSLDGGRFLPGSMLGNRYRIVGLLGRGGMGEVYRADDLKLGQPVALKFLPEAVQQNPGRLSRFLNEVKVALRVTHPNVCRVYDVGEIDGHHLLSMEYVDGEDLASLLRRIGRLPRDKAVQIAHQLCAGLAAAHAQGIVHRDLKPANVMIDGRGRAKIADFGLASLAEGIEGEEVRTGTPAYMAPEQLTGKEVSVKSDLYALGLVLYELFTGKRAFDGRTASEMMRLHAETTPTNPTDLVQGIDAATERVILRCLERAPGDRPESALAVAAALPGGDPLAAALAAGETPAPEMVANAGGEGALRPAIAVPCLIFVLVGLGVLAFLTGKYGMFGVAPVEKPPQALADRAQAILAAAGHEERPVDVAYGHRYDPIYTRHITDNDSSPDRWDRLRTDRPSAIEFWYRQSPRPMLSWSEHGRVQPWDPPLQTSGMTFVALDGSGRLQDFRVVPPQHDESEGPAPEPDWAVMFEAAGLDLESFATTRPLWISLTYCDSRAAWLGIYPDQPEPEIRIEACAYRGRPVYFDIIHPWNKPWRMQEYQPTSGQKLSSFFFGLLYLVAIVGAILLVRRNLRLGRGDRRGGFRLAAFVFLAMFSASLLQADHVGDLVDEMNLVSRQAGSALFNAATIWLIYLAMEPFVRRRWPESLVSWSRVLAGRFRDPLVGKHLLFGATIGVAGGLWMWLARLLPGWLGWAPRVPKTPYLDAILSPRYVLGQFLEVQSQVVIVMLFLLFILVLGQLVFRRIWIAGVVFAVSLAAIEALPAVHPWVSFVFLLVIYGAAVMYTIRFGFVTGATAFFFGAALLLFPLSLDLSRWYAGNSFVILLIAAAVAVYGFYISLAGRPLLREELVPQE